LLAAAAAGLAIARTSDDSSTTVEAPPRGEGPVERQRPPSSDAPNIVVVMTDDQAVSQMRRDVLPKVTKLLGDQGTRFDNAFLTTPRCCPSRATLLTGQYGHNNGVLRNNYSDLRGKRNVLPVWLHRAGYVTAHVGKFLNRYHHNVKRTAVAPGWDQWYTQLDTSENTYFDWDLSANGRKVHYGNRNSDYAPRVFERSAVRLVRRLVPRRRPLYLEIDEIAPHTGPGGGGTPCNPVPDPRDRNLFRDERLPHPPSFNEANVSDKPSFIRALPLLDQATIRSKTRQYRCGLAALREVDRTVGRVFSAIRRLGEAGRTMFIFYSDNGLLFGEHRVSGGKIYPYEEADRTPLLIRLPARYRKGHDRVGHVTQPVANIDFAPTMLRLAHARPCRRSGRCRVLDGRSLLPLLRGKDPRWARHRPLGIELRLQKATETHAACVYAGVRRPGVVFVRHTKIADRNTGECTKHVERERYDLEKDPNQLHNRCFGGGACPSGHRQRHLKKLLARIHQCSGIRGRDPRPRSGKYCG
jgi:N-acetylglucosamine-6-sulfatase